MAKASAPPGIWPAPAKETMAFKWSCRSPVGTRTLTGEGLTCGSDVIPVLLRPCSLIVLRSCCLGALCATRAPWDEGCGPVPAAVSGTLGCTSLLSPTSPFMALMMDPQAVKAHARFPRCSSVCSCTLLAVLRSGPEFLLTQDLGDQITDLPDFPQVMS